MLSDVVHFTPLPQDRISCIQSATNHFCTISYLSKKPYLQLKTIKLLAYFILAIATCTIMEKRIIP